MSQWNVAPPRMEKSKPIRKQHVAFDSSCRCDVCLQKLPDTFVDNNVGDKSGVLASEKAPKNAWHRVGWETRPRRHCKREPIETPPQVEPGPTREKEAELALDALIAGGPGRQYNGPVFLKPAECTYLHSRKMHHAHRTVFLSSTAPKRDSNYGSLLSELDLRLEKLHSTLASVSSRQVGRLDEGYQQTVSAAAVTADGTADDTVAMRYAVNKNLQSQLDFFTGAMASWAAQGRCCGCGVGVDGLGEDQEARGKGGCCSSCSHRVTMAGLRAKAQHHQQVLRQMGVGSV